MKENCFGRGHGLFHIAILTLTGQEKQTLIMACAMFTMTAGTALQWTKAGSLELLHYPPHTGTVHALL
jgi:hypothetical protein